MMETCVLRFLCLVSYSTAFLRAVLVCREVLCELLACHDVRIYDLRPENHLFCKHATHASESVTLAAQNRKPSPSGTPSGIVRERLRNREGKRRLQLSGSVVARLKLTEDMSFSKADRAQTVMQM